jgi:hypothetical protein
VSATEAPWYRPDIFNLTLDNNRLASSPDEKPNTIAAREVLATFFNPSIKRVKTAVRTVIAAWAYARMDTAEMPLPPPSGEVTFPDPAVQHNLEAAHHFRFIQEDSEKTETARECVSVITEMVNRLYSLCEAISSVRARWRIHQRTSKGTSANQEKALKEYDALTTKYGAGAIDPRSLGPLIAFLVSGVKGMLTFPNDPKKYGIVKITHFLVLIDRLNGKTPIEESVWKLTQRYILDIIENALFSGSFKDSYSSLQSAAADAAWQHQEISKIKLAKLVETDLLNFCKNRDRFSGSHTYTHPPFELPDIPAARYAKIRGSSTQAQQ